MDKVSQQAVREITRKVQEVVRSDWEYPQPSIHTSISPCADDPSAYRERYYGTTDNSSDEEIQYELQNDEGFQDEEQDPYQFDSPESVGRTVERKLQARKNRKRKALEEELQHNQGLCFFLQRRNAWTGAVPRPIVDQETQRRQSQAQSDSPQRALSTSSDSSHTLSSPSSSPEASNPDSTRTSLPAVIAAYHTDPFQCPEDPESITDVLIPQCTPMISPSNPVRASMMSKSHSELYEKVVRDNRSPAIPINLAHMTRVIVQGWKDEGNWPPKSGLPEAPIAVRRDVALSGRRVKKEIGMVNRHLDGGEDGSPPFAQGILERHRHLKQGVDSVKRVLRLSGGSSKSPSGAKEPSSPIGRKSGESRKSGEGRKSGDFPVL